MIAILKLIRFHNVLIIGITQYLVRWCVMHPVVTQQKMDFLMSEFDFFLLVLSTMLIAAAGYAINDYFDTRIDRVNKPDRVLIGNGVDRRMAMILHIVMNALGLLIGLYLAYKVGLMRYALIQALTITALWFYSVDLKHRFLVGNLVIAFLAFLVPFLPALYELRLMDDFYGFNKARSEFLLYANFVVLGYSVFAFLTNLIREIVKDMEDVEGDALYGSKTIPIITGMTPTRFIVAGLAGLTMYLLYAYGMLIRYNNGDWLLFTWLLLTVQVPLIVIIINLFRYSEPRQFGKLSLWLKGAMLGGILSMPVFLYTTAL